MSTGTEYKPVAGGEVSLPALLTLEVVEGTEERTDAKPGRLLRVRVKVRKLARPLPAGFTVEPGTLERLTAERVAEVTEGFFLRADGSVAAVDGPEPAGFFGGGLDGSPPRGGRRLAPDAFYLALVAALERETFTAGEVEIFCGAPKVCETLREGVRLHLGNWLAGRPDSAATLTALAKSAVVPGFDVRTVSGGAEALDSYLSLQMQRLSVAKLLELAARIKAEAP